MIKDQPTVAKDGKVNDPAGSPAKSTPGAESSSKPLTHNEFGQTLEEAEKSNWGKDQSKFSSSFFGTSKI